MALLDRLVVFLDGTDLAVLSYNGDLVESYTIQIREVIINLALLIGAFLGVEPAAQLAVREIETTVRRDVVNLQFLTGDAHHIGG